MENDLYLGVDQGSSSTKGALVNRAGEVVWSDTVPVSLSRLDEQRVEQDPEELLLSVKDIFSAAKGASPKLGGQIVAAGLSTQRSGVLCWNGPSGSIVHPMMTHQDTRSRSIFVRVGKAREMITMLTGLPVLANYAAGKIALLQTMYAGGEDLVGTLDTFLLARLTAGEKGVDEDSFFTDDSMASRTLLYNIHNRFWDGDLCALFGVTAARLPLILPSVKARGEYLGVPITASVGDQQAALVGALAPTGRVLVNLGTVSSVLVSTGCENFVLPGFLSSVWYSSERPGGAKELSFLLEGMVPPSGRLIEIIREHNPALTAPSALDSFLETTHDSYPEVVGYFPLINSGTPAWREDLPCLLRGGDANNRALLARAMLEHLAFSLADILCTLEREGILLPHEGVLLSGGLSESRGILQLISTLAGRSLNRLSHPHASARGCALLARKGVEAEFEPRTPIALPTEVSQPQSTPRLLNRFAAWRALRADAEAGEFLEGERITL